MTLESSSSTSTKSKKIEKKSSKGSKPPQSETHHGSPSAAATTIPEGKSKAELKAERRLKQEAQRAAKSAKKTEGPGTPTKKPDGPLRVPDHLKADDDKTLKKVAKTLDRKQVPKRTTVQKKVQLFSHLHQYEREVSMTQGLTFSSSGIHPAVLKLGLQYAKGIICGSNSRCISLLAVFKQVIEDYVTPPNKELARDLDSKMKPFIMFLDQCRPLSVSMRNAIKYMKWNINHIPEDMSDSVAKKKLYEAIDNFLKEKISLAGQAISQTASQKIKDNDVILVYGASSLIKKVLCDAHLNGTKFKVIVVDGRPKLEGREMLRRLLESGIQCSYVLINTASYVLPEVTKVILGAHALLANGYVMSRVGSSQIALLAKSHNVPVLVFCETYKFCERVQTDSFVFNELGDPDDLVHIDKKRCYLMNWRDMQSLTLLNLVYDVTPPELVSVVITELGMIPCTSVPVVLRVKQVEAES